MENGIRNRSIDNFYKWLKRLDSDEIKQIVDLLLTKCSFEALMYYMDTSQNIFRESKDLREQIELSLSYNLTG